MNIRHVLMGMVGVVMFFIGGVVQAQIDSRNSSSGSSTMGSGSGTTGESSQTTKPDPNKSREPSPSKGGPDLTTPGKGGDGLVGGKVPRPKDPKVPDNSGAGSGPGGATSKGTGGGGMGSSGGGGH